MARVLRRVVIREGERDCGEEDGEKGGRKRAAR